MHEKSEPQSARPVQLQRIVRLRLQGRFVPDADERELKPRAAEGQQQGSRRPTCRAEVGDCGFGRELCCSFMMLTAGQTLPRPKSWWSRWVPEYFVVPPPVFSIRVAALLRASYQPDSGAVRVKLHSLESSIHGLGGSETCSSFSAVLEYVRLQFEVRVDGQLCDLALDLGANCGDMRIIHRDYRIFENRYVRRQEASSNEQATSAYISCNTVSAADIQLPTGCRVSVDSQGQVLLVRDDDPTRVPVLRRSQDPVVAKLKQVTLEMVQNTTRDDIQWWYRDSMAGMGFANADDPVQLLVQPSGQHTDTPPTVEVICRASVRIHVSEPRGIIRALWQGSSSMDACFAYAQTVRLGGHMEFSAHSNSTGE